MTDKETIHKVLSSLWKNDDDIRYIYYNQALQDAQTAFDSLPEEPVSEDLEKAAIMHYKDVMEYEAKTGLKPAYMTSFKAGAQWQKQQMVNRAIWCEAHPQDGEIWGSFEHLNLHKGEKIRVIIIKDE